MPKDDTPILKRLGILSTEFQPALNMFQSISQTSDISTLFGKNATMMTIQENQDQSRMPPEARLNTAQHPRKPVFSPESQISRPTTAKQSRADSRNDSQSRKNARERLQALKQSKPFSVVNSYLQRTTLRSSTTCSQCVILVILIELNSLL